MMRPIHIPLNYRLTGELFDARVGETIVYMAAIAIVPVSVMALVRHPGSRADFLFGVGLACLMALLLVMLGMLSRHVGGIGEKAAVRARVPEFASYVVCVGILIAGIKSLAGLGLSPGRSRWGSCWSARSASPCWLSA